MDLVSLASNDSLDTVGKETFNSQKSQPSDRLQQSPVDKFPNDNEPAVPSTGKAQQKALRKQRLAGLGRVERKDDSDPKDPRILLQPVLKPVSQETLLRELRSIYASIVMVENKCQDVDRDQMRQAIQGDRPSLSPKQYQALVALHHTLLQEFHDFFLASQHPSASAQMISLPARHSMPARLWSFAIHNLLEVLRSRLPESFDYMLAFIYIAYQMLTLFYDTVPTYLNTWIECLGDLGRYRMAIEPDIPERNRWSDISQVWYKKARDTQPNIGRITHHLAILSPSFTFEQLSFYLGSLTSVVPFQEANTSILNILTPVIEKRHDMRPPSSHIEILLIKLVAIMFTSQSIDAFDEFLQDWKYELIHYVHRGDGSFKNKGVHIMICIAAGFYEHSRLRHGDFRLSLFRRAQESRHTALLQNVGASATDTLPSPELEVLSKEEYEKSSRDITRASLVAFVTFSVVLQFPEDATTYPIVHEFFVMVEEFVQYPEVVALIESDIPWSRMAGFLNAMIAQSVSIGDNMVNLISEGLTHPPKGDRPLPEDYMRQGLLYGWNFLSPTYLAQAGVDQYEQEIEAPSMTILRKQRVLYLGTKIAMKSRCLMFSPISSRFEVSAFARGLVKCSNVQVPEVSVVVDDYDDSDMSDSDSDISDSDVDMADSGGVAVYTPQGSPPVRSALETLRLHRRHMSTSELGTLH